MLTLPVQKLLTTPTAKARGIPESKLASTDKSILVLRFRCQPDYTLTASTLLGFSPGVDSGAPHPI